MKFGCFCFLLPVFICSCTKRDNKLEAALQSAGQNRVELEKVLSFFLDEGEESEKYRAAVFLIENLSNLISYQEDRRFDFVLDSVEKSKDIFIMERRDMLGRMLDSVGKFVEPRFPELENQIESLGAEFLISNIEQSYRAWKAIPIDKRATFDEYCTYILPPSSSSEPIIEGARVAMKEKYSWLLDSLNKGHTLKEVLSFIKDEIQINSGGPSLEKNIKTPLSPVQVEKIGFGGCEDHVNFLVVLFRSQGLVSSMDKILHWGNHHASGHSWLYVKYGADVLVDAPKEIYKKESIPKVYRLGLGLNEGQGLVNSAIDVTEEYLPVFDVNIDQVMGKVKGDFAPVLSVFDVYREWMPASFGKVDGNRLVFDKVGGNVVYLATAQHKGGIDPVNFPFYLSGEGEINYFEPDYSDKDTAIILRKYPLSSPRRKVKRQWIDDLNGSYFETSNQSDFSVSERIYTLSNFRTSQVYKVETSAKKTAKYVRFQSAQEKSFLARLAFLDATGQVLEGKVIKENNMNLFWENGAYDDDPLSFNGGDYFSLGYEFEVPQLVSHVEFQARNDDNHINAGEHYELFYWDEKWNSLGEKVASDTVLYYQVPKNALFWLRNLTKGSEEHVFAVAADGSQYWLGFDNRWDE